jgi:urease accessory protein
MRTSLLARLVGAAALAGVPLLVAAHTGGDAGAHHGFAAGFMHPFTGLDHMAAMLAVGLWSALTLRRRLWIAPLSFIALLLAGALSGGSLGLQAVEAMIAVSLMVLGLFVAARVHAAAPLGALVVGSLGLAMRERSAWGPRIAGGAVALLGASLLVA